MPRSGLIMLLLLAALSAFLAGPNAFGKLALLAGSPGVALQLLEEPVPRGIASFNSGHYQDADAIFATVGKTATFNRGSSLAATGQYKLALAYFDAVLFVNPHDEAARANRELLLRHIDPIIGEANPVDGGMQTIAGSDEESGAPNVEELLAKRRERIRKPLNARVTKASNEWLATLADAPGEYLKKRLSAEYDRRLELGLAARGETDRW